MAGWKRESVFFQMTAAFAFFLLSFQNCGKFEGDSQTNPNAIAADSNTPGSNSSSSTSGSFGSFSGSNGTARSLGAPVGRFRRRLKMFAHSLSSADSSQQRLRLAQIAGTMPLGEPRRGRLQQGTRLCVPLLAFPQPRKAHCGTQFQRS